MDTVLPQVTASAFIADEPCFEDRERELYDATAVRGPVDELMCWFSDHNVMTVLLVVSIGLMVLAAFYGAVLP